MTNDPQPYPSRFGSIPKTWCNMCITLCRHRVAKLQWAATRLARTRGAAALERPESRLRRPPGEPWMNSQGAVESTSRLPSRGRRRGPVHHVTRTRSYSTFRLCSTRRWSCASQSATPNPPAMIPMASVRADTLGCRERHEVAVEQALAAVVAHAMSVEARYLPPRGLEQACPAAVSHSEVAPKRGYRSALPSASKTELQGAADADQLVRRELLKYAAVCGLRVRAAAARTRRESPAGRPLFRLLTLRRRPPGRRRHVPDPNTRSPARVRLRARGRVRARRPARG